MMATKQRISGGDVAKACPKCGAALWDDGSCRGWRSVPAQPARYFGDQPTVDSPESTAEGSWPWDDWLLAFVWILITPIVTVPVTAAVFDGLIRQPEEIGLPPNDSGFGAGLFEGGGCNSLLGPTCYEYAEFSPTLLAFILPGLVNLLPVLWMLSSRPRARLAGVVAGLLGGIRSAIPILVLTLGYERVTNVAGTSYFRWDTLDFIVPSEPTFGIWMLGAFAWLGCLIALFAFWTLTDERRGRRAVSKRPS